VPESILALMAAVLLLGALNYNIYIRWKGVSTMLAV